ncbi:MAG: IPT/TIG domain-containing protein [Deltaproteobacteria bacterium]|nr:IPT/TIG domain-containing protein [Deltaproteobacteria bacterium]
MIKKKNLTYLTAFIATAAILYHCNAVWARNSEKEGEKAEICGTKIFSIMPSQGEPSTPVKMYVEHFVQGGSLYIDEKKVPYNYVEEGLISFGIPKLAAGNYPLYLNGKKRCKSNVLALKVKESRPVISSLLPARIYYCTASANRIVLLKGDNFTEKTRILFDDIVVGSTFISSKEMEIKIPQAKSGLHHIKAVNMGGNASFAHNFYIEGIPVIYDISMGIKYDGHYELVIEGENFLWGALPLVNGKEIKGDITYKGCNLLVYDRTPLSDSPAELSLQVSNPDGKKSNIFYLSIP